MTPYGTAALGVALMTGALSLAPGLARIANASMLYLLVVIAVAVRCGSGPAVYAAVLSFLAFDWFFVRPRFTFTVSDPAEWLALLVFLITAAIVGHLTALLRGQADAARRRERETAALAEASWAVASQLDRERALAEVLRRIADVVPARASAILAWDEERLVTHAQWSGAGGGAALFSGDASVPAVRFVLAHNQPVSWRDDAPLWRKALPEAAPPGVSYLPLAAEDRVLGVLALRLGPEHHLTSAERRVVESLANHAAVVLERDRLARAETRVNALAEADRLKTALLAMVSHDFRSPLASIKASATAALQPDTAHPEAQQELQLGIIREADRLNGMVGNILTLSRLEADAWRPRKEEVALEEVVEAARAGLSRDANRRVEVRLVPEVEEAWLDPVQMGQVLHNLLDNALKYAPPETRVELRAARDGDELLLEVRDRGPGLPLGEEERVFERFYRAPQLRESAAPGVGIGLSICRGLVEAHGGCLTGRNREDGGAEFLVRLPQRRDA